jgi:hydrogen peroxide-dependent heme synthase
VNIPSVPAVLDGYPVLHQMLTIDRKALRALPEKERDQILREGAQALQTMEAREGGNSALFHLLGHKGDLLLVHFRESFDELAQTELDLAKLPLFDYLTPSHSYLSIIELGMYDFTVRTSKELIEQGLEPGSEEFNKLYNEKLTQSGNAMKMRLFPKIPDNRYLCFYPMNKRRGEDKNWYMKSTEKRAAMMVEHGTIGRKYAGRVRQIISGSIGYDDWEWGVDLFSNESGVFKELVYEMRFDKASALYGEFGQFFLGVRVPSAQLADVYNGNLPELPSA